MGLPLLRVVLDTNILVSALLQPKSLPADVLLLALSKRVQLCLSEAILDEYIDVLYRPRLKLQVGLITEKLQIIQSVASWVRFPPVVEVCVDPDDNIFVACAEATKAHYIVTGNKRHFPSQWENTLVITARELIEIMLSGQSRE